MTPVGYRYFVRLCVYVIFFLIMMLLKCHIFTFYGAGLRKVRMSYKRFRFGIFVDLCKVKIMDGR